MTWDILILTMPTRSGYLRRLLDCLEPQCSGNPDVSIRVRICDSRIGLGENRELLRRESNAGYISFVDDDDLVSEDYVSSIFPLLDGVDQIGFEVQVFNDGVKVPKRDIHSLRETGWFDTDTYYNRDISHLQPMRRELALEVAMEGGHGEDFRWSERMRGRVKTEHYIDKILYFYYFRPRKNEAGPCPRCGRTATVKLEDRKCCNACGLEFDYYALRKSCLWD